MEKVRKARGSRTDITSVVLDTKSLDEVLLEGPKWPEIAKAWIIKCGDDAPVRKILPASVKDDEPIIEVKKKLVVLRITVAR